MKVEYTAEDFKRRIMLYKVQTTTDSELNRIERLLLWRAVWAHVEVKNANDQQTQTGERPTIKYTFVIRYASDLINGFEKVGYDGKVLELTAPPYEIDHRWVVIEAVEIYGKKLDGFSNLP